MTEAGYKARMDAPADVEEFLDDLHRAADLPTHDTTWFAHDLDVEAIENVAEIPDELAEKLRLYDEFLVWSVLLSTTLTGRPVFSDLPGEASYRILSGAITAHLLAIRKLVIAGFDVPAKQILRAQAEHCDVLLLLIKRPELAKEFAVPNDWEAANSFWNRHVRREKARKGVFSASVPEFAREDWYRDWHQFRQSEDTVLSLASHPSFVAAWVTTWPVEIGLGIKEGEVRPGFLGAVTRASVRTLEYAMYSMMLLAAASEFPFGGRNGKFPTLSSPDSDHPLYQRIERGRRVLFGIIERLTAEGEIARAMAAGC